MPTLDEHTLIEDRLTRAAARLEALSLQAEALSDEMRRACRELVAAVKAARIPWPASPPVVRDAYGYDTDRISDKHAAMWRQARQ